MSEFSWDDADMQEICGQCHFKDADPKLCHAVEPPWVKTFVPQNISSCYFLRESHWQRMPAEKKEEEEYLVIRRSERYYSKK